MCKWSSTLLCKCLSKYSSRFDSILLCIPSYSGAMILKKLSFDEHWCLYQTLKCTGSFSTNFHNVCNQVTSIIKLYWIFFLMFTMITIILFILSLSVELIFAPITFLSLLVICALTHISYDMCEKWKFSRFHKKKCKKIFILCGSQNSIVMVLWSA